MPTQFLSVARSLSLRSILFDCFRSIHHSIQDSHIALGVCPSDPVITTLFQAGFLQAGKKSLFGLFGIRRIHRVQQPDISSLAWRHGRWGTRLGGTRRRLIMLTGLINQAVRTVQHIRGETPVTGNVF